MHLLEGPIVILLCYKSSSVTWHHLSSILHSCFSSLIWLMVCSPASSSRIPPQKLTGHSNDVTALEWSPSGAYIASGGSDQRVIVWPVNQEGRVDTENFQVLQHEHGVLSLAWSPSGRILVSGTDWGNIHVWPVKGDGLIDTDAVLVSLCPTYSLPFSPGCLAPG